VHEADDKQMSATVFLEGTIEERFRAAAHWPVFDQLRSEYVMIEA